MRGIQVGLGVLYAGFFLWYTPLRGPLDAEEIEHYVARLAERGMEPERIAVWRGFLESDTGDDFVMVNAIELREPPLAVGDVREGESAREVLGRYMASMWPALLTRACHPVLLAQAAAPAVEAWGLEDASTWSMAGLVRYRSRRDLMEVVMEIAVPPGLPNPHDYKTAAVAKTIAFPADPWLQLGDPRLVLGLAFVAAGLGARALSGARRERLAP